MHAISFIFFLLCEQNVTRLRSDVDEAKSLIRSLRDELTTCQRERDSLRQEKFDLRVSKKIQLLRTRQSSRTRSVTLLIVIFFRFQLLNDSLTSDLERMKKANERLDEESRIQYKIATEHGPPSVATQAMLKKLDREKQNLAADVTSLRMDRDRLRERLRVSKSTFSTCALMLLTCV